MWKRHLFQRHMWMRSRLCWRWKCLWRNVCTKSLWGIDKDWPKLIILNTLYFLNILYNKILINLKNVGNNTKYCSDLNGSSEFKCVCQEGFGGTHCENKCPLECKANEKCISDINSITSIEEWKCISVCPGSEVISCCGNGPTPLCCQNGVCSNNNFVFNETNADECKCLCTDNYSG